MVDFADISVKFNKMLVDSRCPKNVMCNRAGEAIVEVLIYRKGKFFKKRKLTIDASGVVIDANNLVYAVEDYKIYGSNLTPYPDTRIETKDEDYRLQIVVQPKSL